MIIDTLARALLLAALLLPTAAAAGFSITINPDRLNGDFTFWDVDQGVNNQLEFTVDDQEFGILGQVSGASGPDNVTITYETNFPNAASASTQSAAVSQDTQVRVTVSVNFSDEFATDYVGQAAPKDCSASAKIRDNESNDPDDPDKAKAAHSCDLGRDWDELDSGAGPEAPSNAVLTAIDQAFAGRKDVSADTRKGKLSIKHKGEAAPAP